MALRERVRQKEFESVAQEAIVSLLVAAGHAEQELNEICSTRGITHDQYNVLRILRGVHPGGHPRYEISDRLMSRAPDVTRLVDRLERLELVERLCSTADRRLSISRITERGLGLLEEMDPEILAVHERVGERLAEDELRRLAHLCAELIH